MSSSPDLACDIAHFAASLRYGDLPPVVIEAVKANILDTLSCALAGSSAEGIAEVADLVLGWGGQPEASVFVLGGKVPAHHAAWLNSGMAHARDYDDTHDAAILHAGVSTVPAAIAAAQLRGGLSGSELIVAVAAGLEVMCRLGVAVEVDIVETGFIYSSLLGYFAATAAAGRALGLDETQMLNALGIVYSSVAGNHQVTRDASLMKRLQPGLAAQAALVAVQLASRGIRGAQHGFEGADGFFRVYLRSRASADRVREDLGQSWELLNLSYKPYPCCRDTHSSIDAALTARIQDSRSVAEIESVRVGVTGPGYQMVCVPEPVRQAPKTIVEAQFSIPFTVATALIDGAPTIGHFTEEAVHRADILALAGRVHPYVDEEIDRDWSRFVTPARLDIRYRDGQEVSVRIDYPKGHPRHVMTAAEFTAKTADCAKYAATSLSPDTADRLAAATIGLDQTPDLDDLLNAMS